MISSLRGRRARTPIKEQVSGKNEGKRCRGTEGEISYPTRATDALTGDEEQTGKKGERKKETERP